MHEANHTVRVNGVCLHYAAAGAGKPVVPVHGNSETTGRLLIDFFGSL